MRREKDVHGRSKGIVHERDRILQREVAARRMGEIMRGIDVGSYGLTSFCMHRDIETWLIC
jgi:hypothetical protein